MAGWRYAGELLGSMFLVFLPLMFLVRYLERTWHPEGGALIAINLLPMLGPILCALAIWRQLRRMDELQRRIQFDAIATAFLATALITFGWGFIENVGAPRLTAFMVWPIMGTCWGLAGAFFGWRYRTPC